MEKESGTQQFATLGSIGISLTLSVVLLQYFPDSQNAKENTS